MIKVQSYTLRDMFKNNENFAWEILEEQIKLETNGIKIDGEDIARLLALYMKGVQTLNSRRDSREFFFRNRLNNLMMRPNVVQVLSQGNKGSDEPKQQLKNNGTQSPEHKLRKAQLEMRVTYAQQQHQVDLKKAFLEHQNKAALITNTVQTVVLESRNKLEERIKQKRLKAVSARQRSIQTNQQKIFKPQANTLQTLGQIKQQTQYTQSKKKIRSQSLDLKAENQSFVQIGINNRMSLLIPSSTRKQSQQLST